MRGSIWFVFCRHYTKAAESRFHIFTLTLSLGEREQRAIRSGEPTAVDCSPHRDGLTRSPRERAGVRGNDAKYLPRLGLIPDLSNWTSPPAEPEIFQNDHHFPPAQCLLRIEKTPARRRAAIRPGHSPKTFRRQMVCQSIAGRGGAAARHPFRRYHSSLCQPAPHRSDGARRRLWI